METFDENRRDSDGIIQQLQKHILSPRFQKPKPSGQKWLLFARRQDSEMSVGQAGNYITGKVKLSWKQTKKPRSTNRLAYPSDKGWFSKSWDIHMSKKQACRWWITSLHLFMRESPLLAVFLCAFFDCIPTSSQVSLWNKFGQGNHTSRTSCNLLHS